MVAAIIAPPAHPHKQQVQCSKVQQIYAPQRWRRADPKEATIEAYRSCENWKPLRKRFYKFRSKQLFRIRYTPFYCSDSEMTFDGGWYSIPCDNVNAESGGRGGPYCNTYGIIGGLDEPNASSSTWVIYGGTKFAPTACEATFLEQSVIAHKIYEDVGTAAWTPFE